MTVDERQAREEQRKREGPGRVLRMTGILVASLCGLCTATCAGPFAVSMAMGEDDGYGPSVLQLAAVIGVLPFLVGVGLVLWGNAMIRSARSEGPRLP